MKVNQLLKEIKGVFKPPVKKYYFGWLRFGTSYFYPWHFCSTIIKIRRLKLRTEEELKKVEHWTNANDKKFSNLPMVRRCKYWIVKVFNTHYWIEIGWPIVVRWVQLGWKYKWESVRYEWTPSFQVYFFGLQFCIHWIAPDGNNDLYYEMILHYLKRAKKNIKEAEKTWGWVDMKMKLSTWNKDYLI